MKYTKKTIGKSNQRINKLKKTINKINKKNRINKKYITKKYITKKHNNKKHNNKKYNSKNVKKSKRILKNKKYTRKIRGGKWSFTNSLKSLFGFNKSKKSNVNLTDDEFKKQIEKEQFEKDQAEIQRLNEIKRKKMEIYNEKQAKYEKNELSVLTQAGYERYLDQIVYENSKTKKLNNTRLKSVLYNDLIKKLLPFDSPSKLITAFVYMNSIDNKLTDYYKDNVKLQYIENEGWNLKIKYDMSIYYYTNYVNTLYGKNSIEYYNAIMNMNKIILNPNFIFNIKSSANGITFSVQNSEISAILNNNSYDQSKLKDIIINDNFILNNELNDSQINICVQFLSNLLHTYNNDWITRGQYVYEIIINGDEFDRTDISQISESDGFEDIYYNNYASLRKIYELVNNPEYDNKYNNFQTLIFILYSSFGLISYADELVNNKLINIITNVSCDYGYDYVMIYDSINFNEDSKQVDFINENKDFFNNDSDITKKQSRTVNITINEEKIEIINTNYIVLYILYVKSKFRYPIAIVKSIITTTKIDEKVRVSYDSKFMWMYSNNSLYFKGSIQNNNDNDDTIENTTDNTSDKCYVGVYNNLLKYIPENIIFKDVKPEIMKV